MANSAVSIGISIHICCMLLCGLSLLIIYVGTAMERKRKRFFLAGYLVFLMHSVVTIAGTLLRGHPGETVRAVLNCTVFLEFFLASLYALLLFFLLLSSPVFRPSARARSVFRIIVLVLWGALILLLITNLFTGFLYEIDAQNIYHRGAWYWMTVILNGAILLLDIVYMLVSRRTPSHRKMIPLMVCSLAMLAMPVQMLVYGTNVILLFSTFGVLAFLIYLSHQQMKAYYQQENQILKMQNALIYSQIQPHFLYNVLNTIYYLCGTDAEKAQEAVNTFSDYLRENLASFQGDRLIPIEQELMHVDNYLALEKLRFEDKLQIETNVHAGSFLLPALTVQPIVENAVKHGLQSKAAGGKVRIAVRETDDAFSVSVTDDGTGFDPDAPLSQDRPHIGIENVRARLEAIGGSLTIRSAPGEGTAVYLTVPKQLASLPSNNNVERNLYKW